ncbi:lipopolysaccharide biosynthesis protein [Epilithonimonas vandammei]|uniref:lipopolysaccharide biosynthesis protein n=1 Tax=Epilithonimonas vandammei TaxID=2487072 RepID=UPI0028AAC403|nr:oligosaccharide flippase family protein [Epilithonimonas vandammei]
MSSKRNIFKNGIANLIQKFIRVAEQLFLVPFFISAWGAAYYGEWLTLTIIPSVLGFSDFGFGSAAANTFVLRYASGDKQGAANIAKAGRRVITWVILVVLVLSILVMLSLQYFGVFNKSLIPANESLIAVCCMIVAKLVNFYQQLYDALYRAVRKADVSRHLLNIYGFATIGLGILILSLGGGIVAFAVGNLILSLVFNPIYMFVSQRITKIQEFKTAVVHSSDIRETFKIGMGFMLAPAWQSLLFQGSTFVVRLVLGPTAVAIYNTVRTLSRSVNQVFTVIYSSVLPELQYEIGANNFEKARKLFLTCMITTVGLSFLGMIFLAFFGLKFYHIWTHNSLNPPFLMWLFFVLSIGFNALWWTAEVIFIAKNEPFRIHIAGLICSIISLILVFISCKFWGLTGTGIAAFVFELMMAIYIIPHSFKMIGMKWSDVNISNIKLLMNK